MNTAQDAGTAQRMTEFCSIPPHENVKLTPVHDDIGQNFGTAVARDARRSLGAACPSLSTADVPLGVYFTRSCGPHELGAAETNGQGTFNVFSSVARDASGTRIFQPPKCKLGDFIEFESGLALLIAATAFTDINEMDNPEPKTMKCRVRKAGS